MKKGTVSQSEKAGDSKRIDDINKWAFWYCLAHRFFKPRFIGLFYKKPHFSLDKINICIIIDITTTKYNNSSSNIKEGEMKSKLTFKSFSKSLKDFGLNSYEAKSYMSLLEKNNLTAVEVSRLAGIPRARVYETLENLVIKGLSNLIPGTTKKYSAANPEVLKEKLENKIGNVESEIEQRRNEISEIRNNADEVIRKLIPLYESSRSQNDPIDYIEVLKDPRQMNIRFAQLVESAKKEILGLIKPVILSWPPENLVEETNRAVKRQSEILKRGVHIKSIYELSEDGDRRRWQLQTIARFAKTGEEVRIMKGLPMYLCIFDEKTIHVNMEDRVISAETSHTLLNVEHPSLAKILKAAFESYWERAEDYHEYINKG